MLPAVSRFTCGGDLGQPLGGALHQPPGHLALVQLWPALHSFRGHEMHGVAVAAHDAGCRRHVVGDDPVGPFGLALLGGVFEHVLGLRGKADHQRRPHARTLGGDGLEDVRVLDQLEPRQGLAALLDLLAGLRRHAPVGDGGGEDGDVGRQRGLRRRQHLARGLHPHHLHARGIGDAGGPAHERHLRAQRARLGGDGRALLAGRAVGDVAHRIDGLVRRAGGDEHAAAGERPTWASPPPLSPPRQGGGGR